MRKHLGPAFEFARILWHGLTAGSTEEFYDTFSPYYERFFGGQKEYARHSREILEANLAGKRLDAVLECGCGTGVYSAELEELCDKLHGIDFSAGQLSEALERNLEMSLTRGNVLSLPYASGSFDLVTSLGMVRHLPGEMLYGYLGEAYRVLKPKGIFMFEPIPLAMHTLSNPNLGRLFCEAYNIFMKLRGLDEHIGRSDSLSDALSAAGFSVEQIKVSDSETGAAVYDVFIGRKP